MASSDWLRTPGSGEVIRWTSLLAMPQTLRQGLVFTAALVGTSRCDVPAREAAGGTVAPLNAALTAQRAIPTRFRGEGEMNSAGVKLHPVRSAPAVRRAASGLPRGPDR